MEARTIAIGLVLAAGLGGGGAGGSAAPVAQDAKAAAAEAKANAAKLAALDKAFKPVKDDAALDPRKLALAGLGTLADAKTARSLLTGLEQLRREEDAAAAERLELTDKRDELLVKLAEARGRAPKSDEKQKLEKWGGEIKRLEERGQALAALADAIADRFGRMEAPESIALLVENLGESHRLSVGLRHRLALRAAQTRPPLTAALMAALRRSTSTEERVTTLEALGACGPAVAEHAKELGDFLFNAEPRVVDAAIWALAASGAREAIAPLVHRLGEETAIQPGRRLVLALHWLTGADLGVNGPAWRAWLGGEGAALIDGSAPLPSRARNVCFELPLYGQSIAFVIDCSAAMLGRRPAPAGGEETHLDAAKREVLGAIARLPADARYTVAAYAHEPRMLAKTLLPATPENLASATDWIGKIATAEKTVAATSEALSRVLVDAAAGEMPVGRTGKLDVVVLITAGAPVTPAGKPEPDHVLHQLVELRNKPVQALLDVIVLADPRRFPGLAELAQNCGGRFVAR